MKVVKRYKLAVIKWISTLDIMFHMIDIINTAVCYIWKLLRIKSQEFSSQGIFFYFFDVVCIWDDWCSLNFCDILLIMYVSQIIMLYTLNLYSAVCQLYLNKTGRTKRKEERSLINNLSSYLITLEEEVQNKPNRSRRKEIIKIRAK